MKKTCFCLAVALAVTTTVMAQHISKENGMTVVNTTELGKDIRGFKGATPVKIYIKKNKVVKVEALPNKETPKYFEIVKEKILNLWDGKKVKEAALMEIDAQTGATFSAKAVAKNVELGLKEYLAPSSAQTKAK